MHHFVPRAQHAADRRQPDVLDDAFDGRGQLGLRQGRLALGQRLRHPLQFLARFRQFRLRVLQVFVLLVAHLRPQIRLLPLQAQDLRLADVAGFQQRLGDVQLFLHQAQHFIERGNFLVDRDAPVAQQQQLVLPELRIILELRIKARLAVGQFGVQTGDGGFQAHRLGPGFEVRCLGTCRIQFDQGLPGLDRIALAHIDLLDHAAFLRLDDLGARTGNHRAAGAGDLIDHGPVCPRQKKHQGRKARPDHPTARPAAGLPGRPPAVL